MNHMPHPDYFTYDFSVRTNRLEKAIAKTASILYLLVEEALSCRDDQEVEGCEFEEFARDIMGVLTSHADQLVIGDGEGADSGEDANSP